jgi:hypothetical protein
MTGQRWHTNCWLWALTTGCVFITLAFVGPLAGATWNGEYSLFGYVRLLLKGVNPDALIAMILFQSLFQLIPALLVGWVLQALVVVGLSAARGSA